MPGNHVRAMLLVVVTAGALSAFAAAAGGPPVIREPWTPLPCPKHPVSTLDIEGCLERTVTRSDRRINAKAAVIFRLIRRSTDRATFVDGEHAWLRYRRHSCSATASFNHGGSAEGITFLRCEQQRNVRYLADLIDTERILRQH